MDDFLIMDDDEKTKAINISIETKCLMIRDLYRGLGRPFILGLSGGIDSCVCAYLLKKSDVPFFLVNLPCCSSEESLKHSELIAKQIGCKLHVLQLDSLYFDLMNSHKFELDFNEYLNCGGSHEVKEAVDEITSMNVKARLRMIYQYMLSNFYGGLVVGTENRSEFFVGYATKHGDAACDVEFISDWSKTEVFHAAKCLGCPEEIINKAPSADLAPGQTDEGEMGFTYEQLDSLILNKSRMADKLPEDVLNKILYRHTSTRHKYETIKI